MITPNSFHFHYKTLTIDSIIVQGTVTSITKEGVTCFAYGDEKFIPKDQVMFKTIDIGDLINYYGFEDTGYEVTLYGSNIGEGINDLIVEESKNGMFKVTVIDPGFYSLVYEIQFIHELQTIALTMGYQMGIVNN
jgi:hypothetical protein